MVSSDNLLYDNVPASRVADLEHCHENELTQEIDQCGMYRQSVGAGCQHPLDHTDYDYSLWIQVFRPEEQSHIVGQHQR